MSEQRATQDTKANTRSQRPGSQFLGAIRSDLYDSLRRLRVAQESAWARRKAVGTGLENGDEVYRAAAAVFGRTGGCIGCLTVAAPAFRVKIRAQKRFKAVLLEHALAVSRALGANE